MSRSRWQSSKYILWLIWLEQKVLKAPVNSIPKNLLWKIIYAEIKTINSLIFVLLLKIGRPTGRRASNLSDEVSSARTLGVFFIVVKQRIKNYCLRWVNVVKNDRTLKLSPMTKFQKYRISLIYHPSPDCLTKFLNGK